MLVCTVL